MTETVAPAGGRVGATAIAERILNEGPLGMAAVARLCGTFGDGGRPCRPETISRWARKGVRLDDGTVVRLEVCRLNGRLISSRPALVRFLAAQSLDGLGCPPAVGGQTDARDERHLAAVGAELQAAGI